jgi:hypothetical protein
MFFVGVQLLTLVRCNVCQISESYQKITTVYYIFIHLLWEKTFYVGFLCFHDYGFFFVGFMDVKLGRERRNGLD